MTCYSKRDIRAADVLAYLLTGLGMVLMFCAFWLARKEVLFERPALALGFVFFGFGTMLNLKVRELIHNKGVEPVDYEGVPEVTGVAGESPNDATG